MDLNDIFLATQRLTAIDARLTELNHDIIAVNVLLRAARKAKDYQCVRVAWNRRDNLLSLERQAKAEYAEAEHDLHVVMASYLRAHGFQVRDGVDGYNRHPAPPPTNGQFTHCFQCDSRAIATTSNTGGSMCFCRNCGAVQPGILQEEQG